MPDKDEYIQLGTTPKSKKKITIKNIFKRKKKGAIFGKEDEKFLCDDFAMDFDDFDDHGFDSSAYDVFDDNFVSNNNNSNSFGGVDFTLTPMTAYPGDSILKKAIKDSKYMGRRDWKAPDKLTAALAVLGGAGKLMEEAINTAVGSRPRIKEEVPMSMKSWGKYCTAITTTLATESIPIVGQIASPIATAISAAAEGKGLGNISREVLAAEMASLVDGALTTVSLGTYGVVQGVTGQVVAALTILVKAHFYHSTWTHTQNVCDQRIKTLQAEYEKTAKMGLSKKVEDDFAKHIAWLQRQSKKCARRGPLYGKIIVAAEKKFHAAAEKIGANNEANLADYIDYNDKMAAG